MRAVFANACVAPHASRWSVRICGRQLVAGASLIPAGHNGDVTTQPTPKPGWLLVATPRLTDPSFARTVIYVIAHNDEGSLGLVLNRRSDMAVATVIPTWGDRVVKPAALYLGGPVQTDGALAVGVLRAAAETYPPFIQRVAGPVSLVNLETDPDEAMPLLRGVRIFAGHAGWSPGQLDEELAEGSWYVLPGLPDDVLAGPEVDVWFRVLRRQGWPDALRAYHPGDLKLN